MKEENSVVCAFVYQGNCVLFPLLWIDEDQAPLGLNLYSPTGIGLRYDVHFNNIPALELHVAA